MNTHFEEEEDNIPDLLKKLLGELTSGEGALAALREELRVSREESAAARLLSGEKSADLVEAERGLALQAAKIAEEVAKIQYSRLAEELAPVAKQLARLSADIRGELYAAAEEGGELFDKKMADSLASLRQHEVRISPEDLKRAESLNKSSEKSLRTMERGVEAMRRGRFAGFWLPGILGLLFMAASAGLARQYYNNTVLLHQTTTELQRRGYDIVRDDGLQRMINEAAAVSSWKNNNKRDAASYKRAREQFQADGLPLFDHGFDFPIKYNELEYNIEPASKLRAP